MTPKPDPTQPPLQTISSPSTSSSGSSDRHHEDDNRPRFWLGLLAIFLIAAMLIGLIFAAHSYYHAFGGQGFLKIRGDNQNTSSIAVAAELYLPHRKVEVRNMDEIAWGWHKREVEVPYFTCGDQENSCEAYGQQNICCPVEMECYEGQRTLSGIFCCNATTPYNCQDSESTPPKCQASLVQCPKAAGGGCCPSVLECSPNGCIHVRPASALTPAPSPTNSTYSPANNGSSSDSPTSVSLGPGEVEVTVTNTITEYSEATMTLAKEGEVAQLGSGLKSSVTSRSYIRYSMAWVLICIAIGMGML